MAKTVKVTFTNNVDHNVKGDVREMTKDEIKDMDAYIAKWKIKNAYVTGNAKPEVAEDAPKAPKTPAAPKTPVEPKKPKEDETDPAGDLPEDKGNPATDGEDENPEEKPDENDGDDKGDES